MYSQNFARVEALRKREPNVDERQALLLLQIIMTAASRKASGVFFRTVGQVSEGFKLFLAGLIPILTGTAGSMDDSDSDARRGLTYGAMGIGLLVLLMDIFLKIFRPIEVGAETIFVASRVQLHWNKYMISGDYSDSNFRALQLAVAEESRDYTLKLNSTFMDAGKDVAGDGNPRPADANVSVTTKEIPEHPKESDKE